MATPQVARVLYCVEYDSELESCTTQAWLPAPSLLPPLSIEGAAAILGASLVVFSVAYGMRSVVRSILR